MKISGLIIITFLMNLTLIISDCNYITIGANVDKCSVIEKEDKNKSCCFAEIKKNNYSISYCVEIKNTKESINAYKQDFKNEHDLKSIKVKCHCFFLKNTKLLLLLVFLIL